MFGPVEYRPEVDDPKQVTAKIPLAVANWGTRAFTAVSVKCAYVNAWDVPLLTASTLLRDLAAGLVGHETR